MAWPKGKPRKPRATDMADSKEQAGAESPVAKDTVRVKICTKRRPWYDDKPREFAEIVHMDRDMAKRFEDLTFGVILDV